jgi:ABC-type lipoprotein export system ATPase subunit
VTGRLYGTGKSHLLSLISGLAEHPGMAKVVEDKDVAKAAKANESPS